MVSRNMLYNPVDLVQRHEQLVQEKESELQAAIGKKRQREEDAATRAEERKKNTCSARCKRVWRGGKGWACCEKCNEILYCPQHKKKLASHEQVCRGKRRRRN